MRQKIDLIQANVLLSGILQTTGTSQETYVGAPFDCLGINEVAAIITVGDCSGTNAQGILIGGKFGESDTIDGTYTDINDGAINGTMSFTNIQALCGTTFLAQGKLSERMSDGVRKRYIRPIALLTGTAGLTMVPVSITILSSRFEDTAQIAEGVSQATGAQYTLGAMFSTYT